VVYALQSRPDAYEVPPDCSQVRPALSCVVNRLPNARGSFCCVVSPGHAMTAWSVSRATALFASSENATYFSGTSGLQGRSVYWVPRLTLTTERCATSRTV